MYKNRDKVKPLSIAPPLSRGMGDFSSNVQVNIDQIKNSVSHLESSNVSVYNSNVVLHNIDLTLDNINDKIVKSKNQTPDSGTAIEILCYGRDFTYGNLEALRTSSDGKLFVDNNVMLTTIAALTDGSQVSVIKGNDGNDGSGTDRTIKTDGNGALIVDPSKEGIVTSDGTTTALHTMMLGNYNNNLRTVKVGDGGAVNTEVDHSWDNTNQLLNSETVLDGNSVESSTFDLGQGVSHEIGKVEFFMDNSASVSLQVEGLASYNGTDFYNAGNLYSINSSEGSFFFSQEDVGIGSGHRYMKLKVTNNDGLGTSTNVSCQVGYYK